MTEPAGAAETLDAFHRGAFWLVQPQGGHRAGTDAMMLAGAVPSSFAGRLADLGAGAGAAGLGVAARCPQACVVLVERSPVMADYARRTLAHPLNAGLASRAEVLEADVALSGRAREAAGLGAESFDFTILNPPFNASADRASPDALRREAHVMGDALWERWLRTAAALVRPRGGLALIARPESLPAIFGALGNRFGGAELLAIHPRECAPAIRVVLRAWRGSRKRLSLHPPLALHDGPGHGFSPRADAVNNGFASLFGD
ncbi:MAG TPA: methyltransferase [Mesorhizobium sp.]|jgi:tRNA1(Val) A37 N6-methylase TrmN6|nr:methyltransferase [Mesorhizobium sp.]